MTEESLLKTRMRRYLTDHGIYWVSIQGGPGAKPGDPDIVICLKGQFVGIEAKATNGRQSPIQAKREKEIEESGGKYYLVRSMDELEEIIGGIENVGSE